MNKPEFVTTTKPPFAERYDNFIGGQWVAPRSGKYFDNVSPVTGKVVRVTQPNTSRHAEAIGWDQQVYLSWDATSPVVVTR